MITIQYLTTNNIRYKIKEEFKNNNVTFDVCKYCKGTGVNKIKYEKNGIVELCDECNGIGYKNINFLDNSFYICPRCEGYCKNKESCELCNNTGVIDWVQNMRG